MRGCKNSKIVIKNNLGFTLVGVLMVLVVISVLGLSILMTTSNFVKISAGERDDQSVFYIAEAGITEKVYEINNTVNVAFETVKTIYDNLPTKEKGTFDFVGKFYSEVVSKVDLSSQSPTFEPSFGNNPTALITVKRKSENPPIFEIKSVGNIANKTRTVTQKITISLEPKEIEAPGIPGNMALYSNKTIDLAGSVKIYGGVGMGSNKSSDFTTSGTAGVVGTLTRGMSNPINLPAFPIYPIYDIPPNQILALNPNEKTDLIKDGKLLINNYITQGYTLDMINNISFNEIYLDSNQTLIINVGKSDKELVVNHLNVNNGHIKIIGSGKLTIYVNNKITMGSGSTINTQYKGLSDHSGPGNIDKLKIYQKGTSPITLGGSQKIYGSLHAESANVTIGNGGGIQGDVYTGGSQVTVSGGTWVHTQLFLAPSAKFTLSEGGNIKGFVIANSFVGTGGGSITYDVTNPGSSFGGSTKDYGNGSNLIRKTPLIEE